MHILVTNDDGVNAPGLLALAGAMRKLAAGDVTVFAPDRNWSASGHVKTLERPLRVKEAILADGTRALATDGAPSDCVALALLGILERPIDLVVAGVNGGPNLGHDVTYSGTVTAAMEAAIFGLPAVAVSLDTPKLVEGAGSTAVESKPAAVPGSFALEQNYPNPFNPATEICYQIATAGPVRLEVYSVTGQRVAVLVDKTMQPGAYRTSFAAEGLAGGVYVYQLITSDAVQQKKMVLVK